MHEIKDGGCNNTNINRKLSPAQNIPALQGKLLKPRLFPRNVVTGWASQRLIHFLTKREEPFTLAQLEDHDFHRRVTLLGW